MRIPNSTYRLQFHKNFTLENMLSIIPYLHRLGVDTVYASPIFEAVPGSTHGYDVLNPLRINPEIGTEETLRKCATMLKENGMAWLQDIVPNHMAFDPRNPWMNDVLRKGKQSEFASFFDVDWNSDVYDGRLMTPFLGASLKDEIEVGNLKLSLVDNEVVLQYFDALYPLNEASGKFIFNYCKAADSTVELKLDEMNLDKIFVEEIATMQHYQLCHWQETDHKINYRRFFTINGLICLNMQHQKVFDAYHQYIKTLLKEDIFQGLRIDHIDGLYAPAEYLERLQTLTGKPVYTVVEKILQTSETLPENWETQGSTGYDFLALSNNLFTHRKHKKDFNSFYKKLQDKSISIEQQILHKKAFILYENMGGELNNLYKLLLSIAPEAKEMEASFVKKALGAFLIYCPVYRYYGTQIPLAETEQKHIREIFNRIREAGAASPSAVDLLENILLKKQKDSPKNSAEKAARFYKRLMQFSGPLMAKGVEDTLMYTYARFIGHNDVGDAPEAFGMAPKDFHKAMLEREKNGQHSINTTSTHDTKRGEDVRARLNVITDIPELWFQYVKDAMQVNASFKTNHMPDANDEYFLYQTLHGFYPMPHGDKTHLQERLDAYIEKFLREAKRHSGWATPNEAYESATKNFLHEILKPQHKFLRLFNEMQTRIIDFGIINSLCQLILKCTCPGVPDIYQGTELWDLTLVDPDNRQPVNYQSLEAIQNDECAPEKLFEDAWHNRYEPNIKLRLTSLLLNLRKENEALFSEGEYLPLKIKGTYPENVFAFARRHGKNWLIIVLPLHLATLAENQQASFETIDWRDTRVILPPEAPKDFEDLVLQQNRKFTGEIPVRKLYKKLLFSILKSVAIEKERSAGLLLAISSLPSAFGVGDLGTEAFEFLNFLSRSKQQYWQMLPLNPTTPEAVHSPYSSYSAMAGNTLLISPEALQEAGLLDEATLAPFKIKPTDEADYDFAANAKEKLLAGAYAQFKEGDFSKLKKEFEAFCESENAWLHDFALYAVLKNHFSHLPWNEWDARFKNRDQRALQDFCDEHTEELREIKWQQFIFNQQWNALKKAAEIKGIKLFGDLPFYISYDSVDVWTHRDIFNLDDAGNMQGIAGVPPDYFSEDGQLWGMPTFKWDVVKAQNYDWWAQRLKRNLDLFHLVRIDHFRALQNYWEVPAGAINAIHGKWIPGPQDDFFKIMKARLGKLSIVAEDLGIEMEAVYKLRRKWNLPGMKVLQFAWGENMPRSVDIPHHHEVNSIVYTGTHDNNTAKGWYEEETNKADHERMHQYIGRETHKAGIHVTLSRMAYASVARIAILPVQDILGLDAEARMNTPGNTHGNWKWRLRKKQLTAQVESMLREWVWVYDR